jgi:tetratricopeptide (TPR) repeat protein
MSGPSKPEAIPPEGRLDSWKEIAAYLGRSERTVRRWEEHEGLPVHRLAHEKRGSVYAFRRELDLWRTSRSQLTEETPAEAAPPVEATGRRPLSWLAAGIAGALMVAAAAYTLSGHFSNNSGNNPEAVRAFEKGSAFARDVGRQPVHSGIRYLEEATRIDPRFARAWSVLASAYIASTWFGDDPAAETLARASAAAHKALELDPNSGAWKVLAVYSHYADWDHATAEKRFRKALQLNPGDGGAYSWFAMFLIEMGRFDEALAAVERARERWPQWLESDTVYGDVYYFSGNFDSAIPQYRRVLESEPNYGLAHLLLGRAYLAKGEQETAIAELRRGNEMLGEVPFSMADLGYALAVAGKRAEAEQMLAAFMRKRQEGYFPAFAIAEIHLGLGNTSAALDWLERAADEHLLAWYLPSVDPFFRPLRSQPRFRELMQRMNLPILPDDATLGLFQQPATARGSLVSGSARQ